MLVRDVMTPKPVCITPAGSLREALEEMRRHHVRHLPVLDGGGSVAGIITERDIMRAAPSSLSGDEEAYDRFLDGTRVERAMVRAPSTVAPGDPLVRALDVFVERKYGALLVVDGTELVGVLSVVDVVRVFRKQLGG